MANITRSTGLATCFMGMVAGGGYSGATDELDAIVTCAAQELTRAFANPVTIRFNSDRKSGGAWLRTHEVDGFGRNAEIGITAGYYPDPDDAQALWNLMDSGALTHGEWTTMRQTLPRALKLATMIGQTSRRDGGDGSEYRPAVSLADAIAHLQANAILRATYE